MAALTRNPYEVLEIPKDADMARVFRAWKERVTWFNPYQPGKRSVFYTREDYRAAMEAFLQIKYQDDGIKWKGSEMTDWAPFFIQDMLWKADSTRANESDITEPMIESSQAWLDDLPAFIPGPRLYSVHDFDIRAIIERLLPLDEFRNRAIPEDAEVFEVTWRNGSWKSRGAIVFGQCKPLPKKKRALWRGEGTCPLWSLEINLAAWTLMSSLERERLVHHEMCHAKLEVDDTVDEDKDGKPKEPRAPEPKGETHAIEEHIETLGRYGAMNTDQAQAIAHAFAHPVTKQLLMEIGFDQDTGQGLMFPNLHPHRRTSSSAITMRDPALLETKASRIETGADPFSIH